MTSHSAKYTGKYKDRKLVSQFVLPDFTAVGWATVDDDRNCSSDEVRCHANNWEIDYTRVFKPEGEGAWDAVKTKEGYGWRILWKKDPATVQHGVQITAVKAK